MDADKGPRVAKLSDEQYHRAKANNWPVSAFYNPFPFPLPFPFMRTQYEDGLKENTNPYWLCLRDYG